MRQPLRWLLPGLAVLVCLGASADNMTKELIMPGTSYQTVCYTKTGETPGGNLFIIGGCHGDEVAGYLAARRIKNWRITRGTLFLITDAHVAAIERNVRGYPGNMNNMFPGKADGNSMERLANGIWSLIVKHHPQMLVTLHESFGFHRLNPNSYGQTLTHDFHELDDTFRPIIAAVNREIPNKDRHFSIFVKPFPSCPTYNAYFRLGIPATSVETCRQMKKEERIQHQLLMCRAFMRATGLQWDENPQSTAQAPAGPTPQTNRFAQPPAQPAPETTSEIASASGGTPGTTEAVSVPQSLPAPTPQPPVPVPGPARPSGGISILAVLFIAGGAGFVVYALTALVLRKRQNGSPVKEDMSVRFRRPRTGAGRTGAPRTTIGGIA